MPVKRITLHCVFFLLGCFCCGKVFSQSTISGRVTEATYGGGLGNCNVFINNTGIGTITDSAGYFILRNVPAGKQNLIVSYVGFETFIYSFEGAGQPMEIGIELKSRARELPNVVLEPFEEGDYQQWKHIFVPQFIGSTANAGDCRITNPGALRFRYFTKSKKLQAWSEEPLLIENDALGYILTYQLEQFEFDRVRNTIYFLGFVLFTDMQSNKAVKKQRWLKKRQEAYYGSLMHFMRSIYSSRLQEEGFTVRRMSKWMNEEKKRVSFFYKPQIFTVVTTSSAAPGMQQLSYDFKNEPKDLPKDSILYYRKVVMAPDSIVHFSRDPLTADSLVMADQGTEKVLYFGSTLYVQYKKMTGLRQHQTVWSTVNMPADKELHVSANGMYRDARDLLSGGEWSNMERIANLLPWDYNLY